MKRQPLQSMNGSGRVLIVGDKPRDLSLAKDILQKAAVKGGSTLEILTCRDVETAQQYLTYYLNGILLTYPDASASAIMPQLRKLRSVYSGRIALVNADPAVQSYTWGRVGGVDFYCDKIADAGRFANMLLAPRRGRGKTALVLEGGGVLGGFIEFGAVRALYDFGIRDFDMYVGISAGAFVSACAANKIPFRMMLERRSLEWARIYYPNVSELVSKTASFLPNLCLGLKKLWNEPNKDIPLFLSSFFVTGMLSAKRVRGFLENVLEDAQGTNSFSELRERGKELYIIATDLDTTERRAFGEVGDMEVPISQAVEASIALPLTYSPVKIDDRFYVDGAICNAANFDIVIEHGADLIVCVNPLVPFINRKRGLVSSLGPLGILEQSYRSMLHQIILRKIERYKAENPKVTIILIEPDPQDPTMFHNPLNASRKLMDLALVHGYRSTRKVIESQFDFIQRSFLYHGIEISRERVDEKVEEAEKSRGRYKSLRVMTGE
ncbi:patatin-like phospholipase family protein [Candidatus Poribacteria bacterium]|nr:patatin-like phospholipase family protein [Candidatus Poribacteria bacterium]